MKQSLSLLLLLVMVFGLLGCTNTQADSTQFYYLRMSDQIIYGDVEGLICPEQRQLSVHTTDLNYLLQLYLNGPVSDSLVSPFPKGTYLLSIFQEADTLTLVISSEFSELDGIHLTLAGGCLSTTCFELTDANILCIRSGNEIYTYSRDSFLFMDDITVPAS